MSINGILDKIRDPYDIRARVAPGLWVLFPPLVASVCLVGPKHPLLTALMSLAMACGGPYLLGNLIRTWGVNAQNRLYVKWGGKPTTILLRHRDSTIDPISKQRYHEMITRKLGVLIPSPEDEAENPVSADHAYRSATDQLISQTRDTKKFSFLFKELIGYGFNRNMYGARWVGASTCVMTLALVLVHAGVVRLSTLTIHLERIDVLSMSDWLTIGASTIFLFAWLFHFTAKTVRGAGDSYAIRLLECLNKISTPAARRAREPVT